MKTKKHVKRMEQVIADPLLCISKAMKEAIADAYHPAAISLYLRAFPEIAEKISAMAGDRVEREIEAIDTAFDRLDEKIWDLADKVDGLPYPYWMCA